MRIGIDIDEILTPFLEGFLPFYNERHGTDYSPEKMWSYHLEDVMKRPVTELVKEVRAFYESGQLEQLAPFPEAKVAIKELHNAGHELIVITSRHSGAIPRTKPWLDTHFQGLFKNVYFTQNASLNGEAKTKGSLCRELAIPILIDDDERYAEECSKNGITLLLLNKPWNKDKEMKDAIRVQDWQEVLEKIKEKSE
jgi:uncharacterized HAD superfamily protein